MNGMGYSLALLIVGTVLHQSNAGVTSISPRFGSLNGGTRLTIFGTGFSTDQFSLSDETRGNRVTFVNAAGHSVSCDIHRDGCTERQIMCYTRPDMEADVPYSVNVVVDGVTVDDLCTSNVELCKVKSHYSYTPRVESFEPRSGKAGDVVLTTYGRIITTRYGTNTDISINGVEERIVRAFAPQTCELKNGTEATDFYGLELNIEDNYRGTLKCKPNGTFVGNANFTFMIEAPYGRSITNTNLLRVSRTNHIYMVQYYTDITNISPAIGSTAGGIQITVTGSFYEDAGLRSTYAEAEVYVGGEPCTNVQVTRDEYLTCTVPAQQTKTKYRGNRGVIVEYWDSPSTITDNDNAFSATETPTGEVHIDETYFCGHAVNQNWIRMTGIFVIPVAGRYQLSMKATNGGALFVDASKICESTGNWCWSSITEYDIDTELELVVVAGAGTDPNACVELRANHYDTTFTSAMTGKAISERQRISLTSNVIPEKQLLTFSGYSRTSAVNEVQSVCRTAGDGNIRLGLYGVYSAPASFHQPTAVQDALNDFPFLDLTESFSVTANGNCLDITFNSVRGNIPFFTVDHSNVSADVSQTTPGVASEGVFSFAYNGVPSPLITYSESDKSAFATEMQTALRTMFGVQCPSYFDGSSAGVFEGFEAGPDTDNQYPSSEVPAFCGRYSLKNYKKLFPILKNSATTVNFNFNKYLCFAAKDLDNVNMYLKFHDTSTNDRYKGMWLNYEVNELGENGWTYSCIDLFSTFSQKWASERIASFVLVEARVNENSDSNVDYFIDNIQFDSRKPAEVTDDLSYTRLGPAYPNAGSQFTLEDVTVTYNTTNNYYEVIMRPHDCGYNFDDLALDVAQSGASLTINVNSGLVASEPLTGTIKLNFTNNLSQNLDVTLEDDDVAVIVSSLGNIGSPKVESTEDSTCANRKIDITFVDLPGDQPAIMIADENLSAPSSAAVEITQEQNGFLYYEPIPGDMIFTSKPNPQVVVYINNIPTTCAVSGGTDCDFEWSAGSTPTVTNISPTTGGQGSTLTITGTGLSNTASVTIGGVECTVDPTSTSTSITCTVGNGPLETYPVLVNVPGSGYAVNTASNFTYGADVSNISPNQGSLGGSIPLTITGSGFTSGATVQVGSSNCTVVSVDVPSTIVCTLPPYSDLTATSDQTANVVVTVGSTQLATTPTFTYKYYTARVTSVSANSLSVTGDGTIDVSGTNMGTSGAVLLNGVELEVVSRTDIAIQAKTPKPSPYGSNLPLVINYGIDGGAILDSSNAIPTVDVEYEVTNVFPTSGSLYGGTKLTVTGMGFGTNKTAIEVFVGETGCDVDTVTNTQILCEIGDAGEVHTITNEGTTGFGVYFAFSQTILNIQQGDTVQWTWTTPEFVKNVTHGIYETTTLTSADLVTDGINSGTQTKNGQFQHKFTKTDTYYIWSGFTDSFDIKNYRMTINVGEKAASIQPVKVVMGDTEPTYDVNSGVADPTDSSGCTLVQADYAGCTRETVTAGSADAFNFLFTSCRSPSVSSITFTDAVTGASRSGISSTEISITGTGFSTNDCANIVKIGDCECTVSGSTETSFICTPDSTCEYETGVLQLVSVNINQLGNAVNDIASVNEQSIAFVPMVESLSPSSGSARGNTVVQITGTGFPSLDVVTVTFNGVAAECSSINPLTCTSPISTTGDVTVTVAGRASVCTGCVFTYDTTITPTISAVTPMEMSHSTTLTLTGTDFGSSSSAVAIQVGGAACTGVTVTSETEASCTVAAVPAGNNGIDLTVDNIGRASSSQTVRGTPLVSNVQPTSGSVNGGTVLTFTGHGFEGTSSVTSVGTEICTDVEVVSLTELTCTTVANAAAAVDFVITSSSETFPSITYTYADADTPTITAVSPSSGGAGDTVTITANNIGTDPSVLTVTIGGVECTAPTISGSTISCTAGEKSTGTYPVQVNVDAKGLSNTDYSFEYVIVASGINPSSGDSIGYQVLTVTGSGFASAMTVTVCGNPCEVDSLTTSEILCATPAKAGTSPCDVAVTDGSTTATASTQYTYNDNVAPIVTAIRPTRGGTGGGTSLTITGTLLSGGTVAIAGVTCVEDSNTGTQIVCTTGAHSGSIEAPVIVDVSGQRANKLTYYYVDAWSSTATWGGGPLPAADELIVIPQGQVVLLDQDTPILAMILIEGGQLIFDDMNLTLKAQRIFINNGGKLQIGTYDTPFENKGIIELYGHHRDEELPIFGTKVLAVRNGTLELHGRKIQNTWTKLASTAQAGATTITVQDDISDWNVGDEIFVVTTGDKFSTNENEKKTISSISGDTITLDSALEFKHLGEQETFTGVGGISEVFEYRAEVGLLTRNVVVRGNSEAAWEQDIEACEDGFNPGEFVTQTCFEGRFGEEKGSSQFGAQIMIHQPERDTQIAQAHISYTEVTFGGQAFRLGRYPIHFHLNGDMSQSYVEGCGIHHTFNRAINIHGSSNTTIRKNVVYNVMGGALFLEDGIETNNTYDGNLVAFSRASSSLLNDDITPACYWVTNPDNTYINNAAAGGTHFGWWYRMHENPDGPSFTTSVCPRRVPLRKFQHNSAHSFGWFGIWVFHDYYPVADGACSGNANPVPAVFEDFISWNNEKGVEFVNFGALQIIRGKFVQNALAGFEGKALVNAPWKDSSLSPLINDTLIVGKSSLPDVQNNFGTTAAGIVMPYGESFQVHNTKFVNFPSTTGDKSTAIKWTSIDGTCTDRCGGFIYQISQLQFENVDSRILFRWGHEAVVEDIDGSLCGVTDSSVIPGWGTSYPSSCTTCSQPYSTDGIIPIVCPGSVKFHRLAFNNVSPGSLEGKNLTVTNSYGVSIGEFRTKRLTHKPGWQVVLVDGESYILDWTNAENMTNVTFTGQMTNMLAGDCVILRIKVSERPDLASTDGGDTALEETLSPFTCNTANLTSGEWFFDNDYYVNIAVVGSTSRRRRAAVTVGPSDITLNLQVQKCFFTNCIPPPDPETTPPPTSRPIPFYYWNENKWSLNSNTSVMEASLDGTSGPPADGSDVLITRDMWMVISNDTNIRMGTIIVEGGLEIDYEATRDYILTIDFLIINGGRFHVGWEGNPLQGTANIILAGSMSSPLYSGIDGYTIGAKAMAVFGGVELHGRDIGSSWVRLATTADAGTNTISVTGGNISKWQADGEIIITSTAYNPVESERHFIQSVNAGAGTITLKTVLRYRHQASTETVDGKAILLGAAVGYLTRSIIIEGEQNSGEAYGGRIMASVTQVDGQGRTGYVRANYTQFRYMGQDGYTESYDPRLALAYLATGSVREAKPSAVYGCSFTDLYSSAIGAYGIGDLTIENNVVAYPVGNGIVTESENTLIDGNMVANLQWTGAYDGRAEAFNIRYEGAVAAIGSSALKLKNNYVSGSERTGYWIPGEDCDSTDADYENNVAVGNLIGVGIFINDALSQPSGCTRYSGFTVFKNRDWGIYYNNKLSLVLRNNTHSDDTNAMFPMVVDPNPLSHECSDKFVRVSDSIYIGFSSGSVCTGETAASGTYMSLSGHCRAPMAADGASTIGVMFPQFTGGGNNAPEKPCGGIMSYNTLCGEMTLTNTKFINYGVSVNGCPASYAIGLNDKNDDLQHPMLITGVSKQNVNDDYLISYNRPTVGKINPSDCVDMDCDAKKKALLKDIDGGFLGSIGSVIPQSEWEWGGDRRRGLNDGRVPNDMLTLIDGTVITVDQLAPNGRGIARTGSCTLKTFSFMSYYVCPNTDYEMMVIESLDSDTETRRLSPVAILENGYIDLINGPQDHGWCSGYTCQKRISTFHALVMPGYNVSVYFSSTQPDMTRFFMLDADDNECVVIAFYYLNPNRIDVYTDDGDTSVWPTNSVNDNGVFKLVNDPGVNYMPSCSDAPGSNYIDRDARLLYFTLKGTDKIVLKRANVVIVSFGLPAMTEDQFFSSNIIENLAGMLNVPLNKVRVVTVVADTSNSGRKRRSINGITVTFEIGNEPPPSTDPTATNQPTDDVQEVAELIMNSCQEGTIDSNLGGSAIDCDEIQFEGTIYEPAQPSGLIFREELEATHEGVPFSIHPKVKAFDTSGDEIEHLGIIESPWEITASIRPGTGHADATLLGTTTIVSDHGWFNFSDLAISHAGINYILDFDITSPQSAVAMNLTLASAQFTIDAAPLTAGVYSMTTDDIVEDEVFSITLEIRDESTDDALDDIAWRGHTFDVTCSTFSANKKLNGTLSTTFDPSTNRASFDDLVYHGYGFTYISCRVLSTPAEYDFFSFHKIMVISQKQKLIVREATNNVKVRYNVDFDKTLPTNAAKAQLHDATVKKFTEKYENIIVSDSTIEKGSIVVTMTIQGSLGNVTLITSNICADIASGQTVTVGNTTLTLDAYMKVDGKDVYPTCALGDDDDDGLHPAYIALIVVLCLVLIGIIVFVLVYKFKIKPRAKTHGLHRFTVDPIKYPDNGRTVFLAGPNQKIQDIFYRQRETKGIMEGAPPITTLYDDTPGYLKVRKSPLPQDLDTQRTMTPTAD